MSFKIEMRYFYGWDDAAWTEEKEGQERPLRFQSVQDAEADIAEFLASVEAAVAAGDMIVGHSRDEYRIVEAND